MEIQVDGGIHHDLQRDVCGHMIESLEDDNDDISSVGNVSDGCDPEVAGMTVSENGDTDYDANDDEDFEEDEEEEEEEDEDESCDDDSQVHALIDDLELKFRSLVSTKIGEAEQFFDDANTFQRLMSQSTLIEPPNAASTGSMVNPNQNEVGEEPNSKEETDAKQDSRQVLRTQRNSISTQTDFPNLQTLVGVSTTSAMSEKETKEAPEQARLEIFQLRDVRESLITQRQQWAAQLRQAENMNEDEAKKAECKVYEVEEAIEAVDTAIEFKNEVVLGHPVNTSMATNLPPGSSEAELVTRLETLSIEEIRRLLCIYFAKVVELRSSTRRLEKQIEQAETDNEQLNRRIVIHHKRSKAAKDEYDKRIRLILNGSNTASGVHSAFKRMEEQLAASHKKQHDLERSLTELLVRCGYLVNGADYDVKQVVKMLGIESQLAGTTYRAHDGSSGAGAVDAEQPTAHHSRSTWQKGNKGPTHLGHRRNGRTLDGHELSRLHREVRLTHRLDREHQLDVQPQQPTGVRRAGNKIWIQPNGGGAGNSSGGHGSSNHHHSTNPHAHHSSYGNNFHRYNYN